MKILSNYIILFKDLKSRNVFLEVEKYFLKLDKYFFKRGNVS